MKSLLYSCLLALNGCHVLEPISTLGYPQDPSVTEIDQPEVVELDQLILWLQTAHASLQLSPKQALERITELEPGNNEHYDRFRYAVLNQQLNDRTGWIRARDTLRDLAEDPILSLDLARLATVLLQYNQAMINAEARQHQMAKELDAAQIARQELTQKIHALTSLEQKISIRKELAAEQQEEVAEEVRGLQVQETD